MTKITRRSKYLLFWLEKGGLLSHLGMTGNWRIEAGDFAQQKHDHVELQFEKKFRLVYNDPRRFGFFDAFTQPEKHDLLKNIGPEPLEENFTADILRTQLMGRSGPIKNILMSQAVVAGVGNIYASEVLFRVGIKPSKSAEKLTFEQCGKVVDELKALLRESIRLGGSSFDDFKHVSGEKGDFQNHFWVYDRGRREVSDLRKQNQKEDFLGKKHLLVHGMPKIIFEKRLVRGDRSR